MDAPKKILSNNQQELEIKTIINELTVAFYRSFTNKGNIKPNVNGIYQLFIPEGLIIKNCDSAPEIYNLQQFIEPREKLLKEGLLVDFEEKELFDKTEIFGNIAHRFSLYKKSGILSGREFEAQGMKTIQFIKTTDGWKISSLAWDDERDGLLIPDKYQCYPYF
ncbi:hypothetical protein C2W64_03536 [Brevibacillus laterosporus]|nr:DUF4440 domain-containing protein [Brevibacillus laterosporus]RAP22548.1 hypothetical protein C2W64_03536 [Brevibacillus laterosporus]